VFSVSLVAFWLERRSLVIGSGAAYHYLQLDLRRCHHVGLRRGTDLQELLWLRFLSGLGLGSVLPNVIASNAEFTPRRLRATMLVVMSMRISLGAAIPGIVGVTLMPTYGWQVIFIVGGVVPLVIGLCLIFAIPDSIKFMVLRGGRDEAVPRLARKLDTHNPTRRSFLPRPGGGEWQEPGFPISPCGESIRNAELSTGHLRWSYPSFHAATAFGSPKATFVLAITL
jgi:MFS family permease